MSGESFGYGTEMTRVRTVTEYADERGNRIEYEGHYEGPNFQVKFTGASNTLVIHPAARLDRLFLDFDCDNGRVEIGATRGVPPIRANIRVGQDSTVMIGDNVSMTSVCAMSATEGTTIRIGNDVMFASENEVRADDGHPIFDVRTEKRVNTSKSITIGSHVWIGRRATILGGTKIGDGSVIAYGAILKRRIPNNCIAAGVPAKVVKRDIAWERPHLSLIRPFYKPDATTIDKSPYWNLTEVTASPAVQPQPSLARRIVRGLRRRISDRRAGQSSAT